MNKCTIERLHHQIKFEYNKLNSNHKPDILPAHLDDLVYQAILDYIEMFYSGNQQSIVKYGFEQTQNRIDMLASFVYDYELTDIINTGTEFNINYYNFELPKDYLHYVRAIAHSDCGNSLINILQHKDLSYNLQYNNPSIKWNSVVGVLKSSNSTYGLTVYSNDKIDKVSGQYIKIPLKPFSGNYNTLEFINGDTSYPNINSNIVHPNIPIQLCNDIVRIAVINLSDILHDYNHSQIFQNKIINTN